MKKYVKIALLVIVALIFIGTFVFLYQKSQPKASVYTILNAEITDLKKTTTKLGRKPCKTGRNQCQTRRNGLCPYEKTVRKQTYQQ